MTSARRPLPTDIVALVTFDGRVYPNEAKPLERLGISDRAHPLAPALEQWFSFATQKNTWISVRGATIRGLLSARPRAKRSAWEVEALINATDDESVALSLFSRMTAGITRMGGERVFLRMEAHSALMRIARSAGFFAYSQERLYRYNGTHHGRAPQTALRPRGKNDIFGLYELYRRAAPANVRAIEGATFREWQAVQEKWGGRPVDLVHEDDGVLKAWLRLTHGSTGRFAVLAEPDPCALLREAVDVALSRLSASQSVLTLVPHYAGGVASTIEDAGFEPVGEYVALAKRLAKPAEEPVQEATGKTVPVS